MDKKSIRELIRGYNFVVPEIQREYVWGKNKDVLTQFLKDLDTKLRCGDANIGFLYSYASGSEHYMIDGQQRYTTIILLLHSLACIPEDAVSEDSGVVRLKSLVTRRSLLERLMDESRPAFSYRVRSETESFLHNLLNSEKAKSRDIKDQTWFKNEYLDDPTIGSMLEALDIIAELTPECVNLSENILDHVFFWFFDVDETSQGEELYITMNSRGEKLTDAEQIKPRLFKKEVDKIGYGKEWDDWEEFFYQRKGNRGIASIDSAMNNLIRVVLELKTKKEHVRINPVDDSDVIGLEDIGSYTDAVKRLSDDSFGDRYAEEIDRLYGDSGSDGNFYVLKALLTEMVKGQTNPDEFERVYQTIANQVRRNSLTNIAFLDFLERYRKSDSGWYDFILQEQGDLNVIKGDELEKVRICSSLGASAEEAIWKEQSNPFWNGDIKILTDWAGGDDGFSLDEFVRIAGEFNLLFDQKSSLGWTTDTVRQAMITLRLPAYPLSGIYFGYYSWQWKDIMRRNSEEFLSFLSRFQGVEVAGRDDMLRKMKEDYPEDSPWSEFVNHDSLLEYCNTKRVQYRKEYGVECVKNCYKHPCSVKNVILKDYIDKQSKELGEGWYPEVDPSGWRSVVWVWNGSVPFGFRIQYREDMGCRYEVELREKSKVEGLQDKALALGFNLEIIPQPNDGAQQAEKSRLVCYWECDAPKVLLHLRNVINSLCDKGGGLPDT